MDSRTSPVFWKLYDALPENVQKTAVRGYRQWLDDPYYPSLHFKKVKNPDLYSVRVGLNYRALALRNGNTVTWIWIGSHEKYNKLI